METTRRRQKRSRQEILRARALVILCAIALIGTLAFAVGNAVGGGKAQRSSTGQQSSEPPQSSQSQPETTPEQADGVSAAPYNIYVPESAAAGEDYFADALFIGNSRTQGFQLYSGVSNTTYYASKGLTVAGALSKAVVEENGQTITIEQALGNHAFAKVYIMLGINEAGMDKQAFHDRYLQLVQMVKDKQPNAIIYLQSVVPVSEARNAKGDTINNANVQAMNEKIQQVAQECQVYYLDVATAITGGTGVLPADASSDGVHLGTTYVNIWKDYLLTHTVQPAEQPSEPAQ